MEMKKTQKETKLMTKEDRLKEMMKMYNLKDDNQAPDNDTFIKENNLNLSHDATSSDEFDLDDNSDATTPGRMDHDPDEDSLDDPKINPSLFKNKGIHIIIKGK